MKKLIVVASIGLFAAGAMAGWSSWAPQQVNVLTTSTLVVASTTPTNTAAFAASTAYTVGQYVTTNGNTYVCISAGTSGTDAPTVTDGDQACTNVTWRYVRGMREHLTLCNNGGAAVWLAFGQAAVRSNGIRLAATSNWVAPTGKDCPQGEIYAISSPGTTNAVGIQEN